MPERRRKPHRLPREEYRGAKIVAYTSCILEREPIFSSDRPTVRFSEILIEETNRHECELVLACFMPDHLHALIQGQSDSANSLDAFERFKLRSAILLHRFHGAIKWQKNCYDHIVRCDQDWRGQAKYNALNPIRRGLVADAFDYPYFFSSLGDSNEVLSQIFWDS